MREPSLNGFTVDAGATYSARPAVYGSSSNRRDGLSPSRPVRCTIRDARPVSFFGTISSHDPSLRRRMYRSTLMPQVCVSADVKRSCERGIRISTDQPPSSIDTSRLPDRVPAPVVPGVVEQDRIGLHVRRADAEHHPGQMVVHGVEIERDAIGIGIPVARCETTADLCGIAVEETHADVQRAVVVEHADFSAFGGRLTFVGIDLCEVGHDLRLRPGLLVELSVDRWRACRAGGAKLAGGGG